MFASGFRYKCLHGLELFTIAGSSRPRLQALDVQRPTIDAVVQSTNVAYGAVAVLQCLADALAAEWHPLTSINCKRFVSANASDWSVAMHLGGQMRCNYAEPMRVGMQSLPARVGLAEKAPRERLVTATVATSVAMLQTRYYAGCRRCRRCRQINHHSI